MCYFCPVLLFLAHVCVRKTLLIILPLLPWCTVRFLSSLEDLDVFGVYLISLTIVLLDSEVISFVYF